MNNLCGPCIKITSCMDTLNARNVEKLGGKRVGKLFDGLG